MAEDQARTEDQALMRAIRTFVIDVLERLVKTFLQAFAAALAVSWGASALSVPDLQHWSTWAKLLTPAIIAGAAAVLSAVSSLLSSLKTGSASASMSVASTAVRAPSAPVTSPPVVPAVPEVVAPPIP